MKQCAFLSMENIAQFECYDSMLVEPFKDAGWQVHDVPWRAATDWDSFDCVIVRSPWDYQQQAVHFLAVLQQIEASRARLANPLHTMRWNINKRYLQELQQAGIPIVPTCWLHRLHHIQKDISPLFSHFDARELIIKPTVSANADHTYRLTPAIDAPLAATLERVFAVQPAMVQPFMPNIVAEGEFSLFYFNNEYSHAILKTPGRNDFRVQEEHGARLKRITPSPELRSAAQKAINATPGRQLFARVDFVRVQNEEYALMELELIEPSLYFNMAPEAAAFFTEQFLRWYENAL